MRLTERLAEIEADGMRLTRKILKALKSLPSDPYLENLIERGERLIVEAESPTTPTKEST